MDTKENKKKSNELKYCSRLLEDVQNYKAVKQILGMLKQFWQNWDHIESISKIFYCWREEMESSLMQID